VLELEHTQLDKEQRNKGKPKNNYKMNFKFLLNLGTEKINQLLFLQKNFTLLKQLFHESRRKRIISMSSTTTVSSEDSTCTMPKQSRIEDEDINSTSDDIEIYFY
jgi:hypothetical protein